VKARDPDISVQYLGKVGPKRAAALAEHGLHTIRDLLYYFPFGYIDLTKVEKISSLKQFMDSGKWITAIGEVRAFDLIGRPPRQRFVVVLGDDTATIQLVFFGSIGFFKKAFSIGETLAVSGKVTGFRGRPQIVHPSIDRIHAADETGEAGLLHTRGIVPKYGSSGDLRSVNLHVKALRQIMRAAVEGYADQIEENLPPEILKRHHLMPIAPALRSIHFPESQDDLERARHRLKFDELFTLQLMLALRRNRVKMGMPGISFGVKSKLARRLVDALPFKLTKAQVRVVKEIAADMNSPRPMNRLLQGDVGSGKTIVALIAMLIAIENGYQAAFMAPTEILAEQHYMTLNGFLKDLPIRVRLLLGGQRAKVRDGVLEDVRGGSAQLIVGTHALIQADVEFAKLGLVIIDEQHRFGVTQRVALKEKGEAAGGPTPHPDVLVMTATPIPRTLSLTIYGDLDVSIINELPSNRLPVETLLKFNADHQWIYRFIKSRVEAKAQAYIVYPLVEESEKLDLKAATESYELLKSKVFADFNVGLIHGRMPGEEKDTVMAAFKSGNLQILVATSVIEVGIDIPNASVMVIEHAERFGLSQLHQLRGRVGRGAAQSTCIMVAPDWMGKLLRRRSTPDLPGGEQDDQVKAVRRLTTMLETADGFKIAETDLEIRGPGDFFGTRQSGLPELRIADLTTDEDLLKLARGEAFNLLEQDPHLRLPEHQSLRNSLSSRTKEVFALIDVG